MANIDVELFPPAMGITMVAALVSRGLLPRDLERKNSHTDPGLAVSSLVKRILPFIYSGKGSGMLREA